MQNILIEKPYKFIPPIEWHWPQRFLTKIGQFKPLLRKEHGVVDSEIRHLDRLRQSIRDGHGIMICPNHPRTADPIAMYHISQQCPVSFYSMASWHLFNQTKFTTFMLRLMGAFSVNREGLDRTAVDYAINVLVKAERPLLIFPSGSTSRTNDRLMAFMDGPGFIARTAAKRRKKEDKDKKVVVHPVCIKYFYQGDIEQACLPVLDEIEKRLTWQSNPDVPMIDRIIRIGDALLTLKELHKGIRCVEGQTLRERQNNMVDRLLSPLEEEWLGKVQGGGIQTRVKNLRMKIFPDLSRNEVDAAERKRRWHQLEDTYLAQQIDCYPENYLVELPSVDRILETVEKFEEDIKDKCRIHGKLKVVLNVGEAIEVSTKRDREATSDPLMSAIRSSVAEMLETMQHESKTYSPTK